MNRRSGYSLLEVLVAFAIMAVVLAVLLPSQSSTLRQAALVQDVFLATAYSQSRLDRLGISDPLQEGVFEDTYRNWHIVTSVALDGAVDALPEVHRVSISVFDASGRVLATQETLKVDPQ